MVSVALQSPPVGSGAALSPSEQTVSPLHTSPDAANDRGRCFSGRQKRNIDTLTFHRDARVFAPTFLEHWAALRQPCENVLGVTPPRPLGGALLRPRLTWPRVAAFVTLDFQKSFCSITESACLARSSPASVLLFMDFPFSFARPH